MLNRSSPGVTAVVPERANDQTQRKKQTKQRTKRCIIILIGVIIS